MKRILISSKQYYSNPELCNKMISHLAKNSHSHTVVISNETLLNECMDIKDVELDIFFVRKKYDTIKDGTSILSFEDKLNIKFNTIVMLDLSGIYGEKSIKVLHLIKRELFLIGVDISALLIVCDELELPVLTRVVYDTFRVNAINLSPKQLNDNLKHAKRVAFVYRFPIKRGIVYNMAKKVYKKMFVR